MTSLFAGLGDADNSAVRTFQPWCGKRENNCTVSFAHGILIVNDKDSITRDQFRSFSCDSQYITPFWGSNHWEYTCQVIYNEDGADKSGVFIFVNGDSAVQFKRALAAFCGSSCRPVGPSIKFEQ